MEIIHAIPGRVRVRVPEVKGNPQRAAEIERKLGGLPAIRHVHANPATGSVLIHYAYDELLQVLETISEDKLREWLEPLGLSPEMLQDLVVGKGGEADQTPKGPRVLEGSIRAGASALDEMVGKTTGVINLRLLVPILLAGLGVRALLASGSAAPAWYEYFWFALGTFFLLNPGAAPEKAHAGPAGSRSPRSLAPRKGAPRLPKSQPALQAAGRH